MKIGTLNHWDLLAEYLHATGKFACIVSSTCENAYEIGCAAPHLTGFEAQQVATGETLYVIFDDEESATEFFGSVVGDDGPTKSNLYTGPANVFACLCGPEGIIGENT